MVSFIFVPTLILILCSISHVSSLQCYACADTGADNDCEQYQTYKDGADGKRPGILKNCSAQYDEFCYRETYSSGGLQVSHIRDCGNPLSFSFSHDNNNTNIYRRLNDLGTNNETACIYVYPQQICLSKCDTDFCNGPLITDVNNANVITWSLNYSIIAVIISFIRNIARTFP